MRSNVFKSVATLLAIGFLIDGRPGWASESVTFKHNADRDLVMTITKPTGWSETDQHPAILFFYNGGWKDAGAMKPQFEEQARYFAARGMVVGQADYREKSKDGPTSSKCVEDIFSGIRWLRRHATELGIDPKRIAAVGGSGSIHLPAAALHVDEVPSDGEDASIDPLPRAIFLFNPDPDVLDPAMMSKLTENRSTDQTSKAPPIVIYYGSRDAVAPFLDTFVAQAKHTGLPVEKFIGEGGVHGFFKFSPGLEQTLQHMDDRLCALGLLDRDPKVDLPHKEAPADYEARILETQQRWLERHNEITKAQPASTQIDREKTIARTDEFLRMHNLSSSRPLPPIETVAADQETPALKGKLESMLTKAPEADANKDGVLTMDEAKAFKMRSKNANPIPKSQPMVAKAESNNESSILIRGLSPSHAWDIDRDGKISKTEFKAPAQLFQNMDIDGDGFLADKELAKLDSKLNLDKTGETTWIVPPERPYHGVSHHRYMSESMKTEVGYNIYLPDEYEKSDKRYPVIYHLHGSGGNESVQTDLSVVYHKAIEKQQLVPAVVVFVNGGRRSYYSDSADGKILAETTIIKELIPHIDSTYRTIPEKACRAIHGFSMGGFGALKIGMKYPELFSAILSFSGGMASPGSVHMDFLKHILGNDEALIKANNPADLAIQNKAILQGISVWLFTGTRDVAQEDSQWAHQFLTSQGIEHRFEVSEDTGHALKRHFDFFGDDIFAMLNQHFTSRKSNSERISQLESVDLNVRAQAVIELLEQGPLAKEAYPSLIKILTDDEALDALVASRAIYATNRPAMDIGNLLTALSFDTKARVPAAWELSKLGLPAGNQAAAPLIESLRHPDKHERNFIVAALATSTRGNKEAVQALLSVLQDVGSSDSQQTNYKYPRATAAVGLGMMEAAATEAIPALLKIPGESNVWEVQRAACCFAIGRIGVESPEIGSALKLAAADSSPIVRDHAAMAMKSISRASERHTAASSTPQSEGFARLIRTLSASKSRIDPRMVAGLQDLGVFAGTATPMSKRTARKAALPVHESISLAIGYLDSLADPPTPAEVAEQERAGKLERETQQYIMALGGVQQGIAGTLLAALSESEQDERIRAIRQLAAIGPSAKEAIPALKELLQDNDWLVRRAAFLAIERIES